MKKLKVRCLFKDTYTWQLTEIKTTFEVEEDGQIVGIFPDIPQVREAIQKFLRGEPCPNILDFCTRYKLLRAELYSLRDSLKFGKRVEDGGNDR